MDEPPIPQANNFFRLVPDESVRIKSINGDGRDVSADHSIHDEVDDYCLHGFCEACIAMGPATDADVTNSMVLWAIYTRQQLAASSPAAAPAHDRLPAAKVQESVQKDGHRGGTSSGRTPG